MNDTYNISKLFSHFENAETEQRFRAAEYSSRWMISACVLMILAEVAAFALLDTRTFAEAPQVIRLLLLVRGSVGCVSGGINLWLLLRPSVRNNDLAVYGFVFGFVVSYI